MSNPNKAKGTAHETAVRHYLNDVLGQYRDDWKEAGYPWRDPRDPNNVTRPAQTGVKDVGDLHAWPAVLECKAEKEFRLPAYVAQANKEARNAGFPLGVAVVKAPRKNIKDAYVVMDLETFAQVLRQLREGATW
ncbi:hypothetical protein E0L36_26725 [Streptomyces sp. AJS327]|uniref:hypothetical protein n=1 Tax=Streptomyces sp. AJS327 TaxID=2545265 RepID=UPI0015DFFCDE|nr:hypothetical protein [Streptomyces sp. AJS327]MBA0054315.1 hypothetical protein [Streptomyces sp. AJS327]